MKKALVALVLCLTMLAGCAAFAEGEPALLAYYTFDDAENLGADASGNGNDLVKAVNPDGVKAVEGVKDGGVYFGGSSGLIAKDDANNDFMDLYGSNPFTISFCAKVDLENARVGNSRVVDEGINGSDEGFTMLVNMNKADDGAVSLTGISKVGGSDWWGSATSVTENADGWHQYVMVYDPANELVVAFVDGVKLSETYAEENEVVAGAFTFCVGGNWAQWDWFMGGNRDVTCEGFCGTVDEVKVIAGAVYDMDVIAALGGK